MKTFCILAMIFLTVIVLTNRKINIFQIIKQRYMIYRDYRTGKFLYKDMFVFELYPILMAVMFLICFDYEIIEKISDEILMIFSILGALLFSLFNTAISIKEKYKDGYDKIRNDVMDEVLIAITVAIFASVVIVLLVFLLTILTDTLWLIYIINFFIIANIIIVILNLIMIIKRIFLFSVGK